MCIFPYQLGCPVSKPQHDFTGKSDLKHDLLLIFAARANWPGMIVSCPDQDRKQGVMDNSKSILFLYLTFFIILFIYKIECAVAAGARLSTFHNNVLSHLGYMMKNESILFYIFPDCFTDPTSPNLVSCLHKFVYNCPPPFPYSTSLPLIKNNIG